MNTVGKETKKVLLPTAVPSLEQELEGTGYRRRRSNELIYSSLVEYCCCGAVTVAADVTINHVEADDLGHTMMLHDPKNNSNPAVFIGIFFFREHRSDRNKKVLLPAAVPSLE